MSSELHKWTMPDCYFGATWEGYYVFLGQNRDSDALTRSNFRVALKRLGGVSGTRTGDMFTPGTEEPTITVVRESHWACGWVEWIAIHESNVKALEMAREMLEDMDGYPVLDESDWSELEYTEAMEYWDSMPLASKVDYCRDCGVSVFAARRDSNLPDAVYESLTGA